MRLHKETDETSGPCFHMEGLLNRAADGSAKGIARWYALAHAARCSSCNRFLAALTTMLQRLQKAQEAEPAKEILVRLTMRLHEDLKEVEGAEK